MKGNLYNSVSSLRRNFTLPEGWNNERIFLHFDGIYSGAYVWVNGQKVGYTQGSNNDAEFDITAYVHEGDNNLSVQVFRFTDGSYLEGQDCWHMSAFTAMFTSLPHPRPTCATTTSPAHSMLPATTRAAA